MTTSRAPARARWAAALLWLACAHTGVVQAQASAPDPLSAAVLEDAPPMLRKLLQQASALESATETPDSAWQAAVLYCQTARWGSVEGQYRLGMLYAFGQGVPENRAYAAALFSLAASLGHAQAHQMLDTIELTSSELPACVNQERLPEIRRPGMGLFEETRIRIPLILS